MNSNYINNKYTIEYHPKQKNEERKLVKPGFGDSTDWTQSTGSSYNTGWTIITGSSDSNEGGLGRWLKLTGSGLYTINYNTLNGTQPGVVHWVSKSEGWRVNQIFATGVLGNVTNTMLNYRVKWADVDGRTLITSYEGNNELYIFTSRSGGWYQSQTLTRDSWEGPGELVENYWKYSWFNCKIAGDTIFSNGHRVGAGYYVAWWKSSSAEGWKYHDSAGTTDDSSIGAYSSTNASVGLSSCNIDFDGSRAIAGSKIYAHGYGAGGHSAGRLFVFDSSSAYGWHRSEQLTLQNLGRTSDSGSFAAWHSTFNQEWKLYSHWSYLSCVQSGNYIAASAIGRRINQESSDYPYMYRKVKNAVFILKSGSSGWVIDQKFKDPSGRPESESWSGGSLDAHRDDSDYGLGMAFIPDTGDLIVSSPAYNSKFGTEQTQYSFEGRVYIYSSASSTGWTLKQTIENPYSGSIFHANNIGGWNFAGQRNSHPEGGSTQEGITMSASGSLIAIGCPNWQRHPAEGSPGYTSIDGAIVLLSGSRPVQPKTLEAVPFRFLSNGPYNLRKQDKTSNHRSFRGKTYV